MAYISFYAFWIIFLDTIFRRKWSLKPNCPLKDLTSAQCWLPHGGVCFIELWSSAGIKDQNQPNKQPPQNKKQTNKQKKQDSVISREEMGTLKKIFFLWCLLKLMFFSCRSDNLLSFFGVWMVCYCHFMLMFSNF